MLREWLPQILKYLDNQTCGEQNKLRKSEKAFEVMPYLITTFFFIYLFFLCKDDNI